jgi:O-antigen/teichoic acid export membrane protein
VTAPETARPSRARHTLTRLQAPGPTRAVAATAVVNVSSTVVAATAGVILARSLGPSDRGDYAAVVAWFGVVLIIGELGQTAATTYHVARHPENAKDYTATSRVLMTVTGALTAGIGFLVAPLLAHGDSDLLLSYRVVFVVCLPVFVGAGYSFALQAVSISRWNVMRIAQPIAYLLLVVVAQLTGHLTLVVATAVLALTVTAQAALSYGLARRSGLTGGRARREHVRPLTRYGFSQVLASAPQTFNGRLDQLVLSQTVRSSELGHYAVAVTLSGLAVPVVSALGNVLFPRLAAMKRGGAAERRLVRSAVLTSSLVALVVVGVLTATAFVTVPLVFGPDYDASVRLVWLLAPAGVLLASTQVASDLLRGRGQPGLVARAQGVGLVLTIILLAALIPRWGASGAAVATGAACAVTWALLMQGLRVGRDRIEGSRDGRSR